MELDEEERYACAAVFTLALHQCQVDCGIAGDLDGLPNAWGNPSCEDDFEMPGPGEEQADVSTAKWSAFWGWDCYGPRGVLEQLYAALHVPERAWSGLKRLPGVGGIASAQRPQYMKLVSSHIRVLDPDLPVTHLARVWPSTPPVGARGSESKKLAELTISQGAKRGRCGSDSSAGVQTREMPDFLDGVTSDSDSDLEHDLANVHLQRRIQRHSSTKSEEFAPGTDSPSPLARHVVSGRERAPTSAEGAISSREGTVSDAVLAESAVSSHERPQPSDSAALRPKKSLSRAEVLAQALQRWQNGDEKPLEIDQQVEHTTEGAADFQLMPALTSSSSLTEQQVSGKALAAMWTLLEACTSHPPLDDGKAAQSRVVDRKQAHPAQNGIEAEASADWATVGGAAPVVRWYDSRSRAGLRTVARWLRLPWRMVVNFESLLVYQMLLPGGNMGKREMTPWEHSIRAAKIGAATLTIGALFALTGGVAAPAIAGGVGAAIGLAGGSAAVATGVSGFLGTAAGGAVIASTMGAAGVGLSAPHVAHRIGNVREFGFWPLADKLVERVRKQQDAETGRSDSSAAAYCPGQEAASSSVPDALLKAEVAKTGANVSGDLPRPHVEAAKPADPGEREGSARGPDFPSAECGEAWKETREKRPFNQEVELRGGGLNTGSVADFGRPPDSGHITLRNPTILTQVDEKPCREADPTCEALSSALEKSDCQQSVETAPQGSKQPSKPPEATRWWWRWRDAAAEKEPPLLPSPVTPSKNVEDMRMSLTIGVSGWISQRKDFQTQWLDLTAQRGSEVYTLVWESRELVDLNNAIVNFAASQAGQEAAKWVLQHFFFTGLVAALAWPAFIYSAVQLIDTAWSVALQRAQKAGRLLAHILAAGAHGDRPVILVGNSMGARLIFHCLLELSRLKAKGIVEHVCLLGMPVALHPERWAMARSVVAGRLVNGFSRKDWLLAVVYRGANGFIKDAAGLCPAPFPGVENVNLTGLIQSHFDYIHQTGEILDLIDLYD